MPSASVIVTGATGSMGRAAVKALALKGESVIAVCRNAARGEELVSSVRDAMPEARVEIAIADLGSLASVRAFADSLEGRPVKGLFNNAGTLLRNRTLSADGLEMCVAVNYVAPFVLCNRIGAMMEPGGHIVNMVSLTSRFPEIREDFFQEPAAEYSQLGTYAKSKLALLMFSREFALRNPSLRVNVSDPGIVNSNMIKMDRWFDPLADIFFRPFCSSPEKGVAPALRALETDLTGKLFVGRQIKEMPLKNSQSAAAEWLWNESCRRFIP